MKKKIILFLMVLFLGILFTQKAFAASPEFSGYGYETVSCDYVSGWCNLTLSVCWNLSLNTAQPGYFYPQLIQYSNGVNQGPIPVGITNQGCLAWANGQTTPNNIPLSEQYFNNLKFVWELLLTYPDGSQSSVFSGPFQIIDPYSINSSTNLTLPCPISTCTTDPVNIATGEDYFSSTDFSLGSRGPKLELYRKYRSFSTFSGIFGYGWRTDYDTNLSTDSSGDVIIYDKNGTESYFLNNSGTYVASPGNYSTITHNVDNTYTITDKNGIATHYNINGQLSTRTDRNGNTLTFVYNPSVPGGTYIQDASGRQIKLYFNSNNLVTSAVDPAGKTFQYGYDVNGNLVSITDSTGAVTNYYYNSNHQITQFTNSNGHNRYYQYDSQGRAVSTYQANNVNQITLNYEGNNTTVVTDSLGNSNTYVFNNNGLLLSRTDPLGNVTQQTWDPLMNLLTREDARNNWTSFSYFNGNLTQIMDPFYNVTNMTYTPNFNLISSKTDALGNVTNYNYDANGNLTSITDALGGNHSYVYDGYGNVITATDSLGNSTNFTYDAIGHVLQKTDALGNNTIFTYE